MFALKIPCTNCPWTKKNGPNFGINRARLTEFAEASAFQCHKTLDYDKDPGDPAHNGTNPQQCPGLMATLRNEGKSNQIMQVGARFGALDIDALDPRGEAYDSIEQAILSHAGED